MITLCILVQSRRSPKKKPPCKSLWRTFSPDGSVLFHGAD